ncbi:transcriptional regulator, LacI family [Anaerolinea thermolimosa]|uniref:LacI family DNA-binding transcriptional regulator n=1 Tax=Anaerolinea thermolimosa TaxID=229919 RepID=UPI000785B858|nr:LacI family DNA-binding transcriptional regulator [Anaerolinea thermolimosa]GAP08061.1 transcriptional regulator, LacI family [Anaerolinea thermolimosa]
MPTIQDVARRAGVAPITASRVINNNGYASQDVRQRVLRAVEELGYVPNTLARSLRSRRTNTLALILTDITNPFFTTVARGVEDAASDAGYTVIFCNTDENEDEEQKYLNLLLQKRVDGILLVPARSGHGAIQSALAQGVPLVVIDRRVANEPVDVVRCDSEGGAYALTRRLIRSGYQRIALLNGPKGVSTAEDRAAGYLRALAEAGLQEHALVFYGHFTQASGAEMTTRALLHQPPPQALFAANNFIAIGALQKIRELDVRIPEDLALVGFDDLPPALVTFPFLTVVAQPAYEMGQRAARMLIDRLEGRLSGECREIILPAEIIIRQSSGPIHLEEETTP